MEKLTSRKLKIEISLRTGADHIKRGEWIGLLIEELRSERHSILTSCSSKAPGICRLDLDFHLLSNDITRSARTHFAGFKYLLINPSPSSVYFGYTQLKKEKEVDSQRFLYKQRTSFSSLQPVKI